MNWDDLRFVLTLARAGSLARAARELRVDHSTVSRRVDAAEADLKVRLFTRTPSGYVPTAEAEALLPSLARMEEAALALERGAQAQDHSLEGHVRVTSGETFGACYLAPRLVELRERHPGLTIELETGGATLDLARREADVAVRLFRSRHESLVVKRAGELAHGLYASREYLARRPVTRETLADHPLLMPTPGPNVVETAWALGLAAGARAVFTATLTVAVQEAARRGAGVAVLPRYLGDPDPVLRHVPMPDEPREPIWLTVHRDLQRTPRVRAVLDFLAESLRRDSGLLLGRPHPPDRGGEGGDVA